MSKNNKNIAGASLIEAMVAMILIALALTAIASTFPRIAASRRSIPEAEQARAIAMETLNAVQSKTNTDYCINPAGIYTDVDTAKFNRLIGPVQYNVTAMALGCDTDPKTVAITVTRKKAGKSHDITVTGAIK